MTTNFRLNDDDERGCVIDSCINAGMGAHVPDRIAAALERRKASYKLRNSGKPFFVLWNPDSDKPVRMCWATEEEAWAVAEGMVKKYPDQHWFVLLSVGKAEAAPQPVQRTQITIVKNIKARRTR